MSDIPKIPELLKLIAERQTFLVTSHARPDGDAIGSALAMMHLLEGLGKKVDVAFADPVPVIYASLPGAGRITATLPATAPDAAILLEISSLERSGFTLDAFAKMGPTFTINIDHHQSGRPFAGFNWIDPESCAVGAMLYDVAIASGVTITPEMATCLYTAIVTDTGSFSYSSTVASTLAMASHLIEFGADPSRIAQDVFFSRPLSQIRLLGVALHNMQVELPLAWTAITLDDMAQANATSEDTEGIVNQLVNIAGVEAGAFFREAPGGKEIRVSLRSKDAFDVARIAEVFGGGGHRNAAGCTLPAPIADATSRILAQLRAQLC